MTGAHLDEICASIRTERTEEVLVEGFIPSPGPFEFTEGLCIQIKRVKKEMVRSHVPESSRLLEWAGRHTDPTLDYHGQRKPIGRTNSPQTWCSKCKRSSTGVRRTLAQLAVIQWWDIVKSILDPHMASKLKGFLELLTQVPLGKFRQHGGR